MRKVFIGFGVILLLLVAAAFVAPYVVDLNKYHVRIANYAEEVIGRPVHFQRINFSLLPKPSLTVDGLTVYGAPSDDLPAGVNEMATVGRLSFALSLKDLIGGHLVITNAQLWKPIITLTEAAADKLSRQAHRHSNVSMLARDGTTVGADPRFTLIVIEDGRFTYLPTKGKAVSLANVEANLSLPDGRAGPLSASLGAALEGQPVTVDAALASDAGRGRRGLTLNVGAAGLTAGLVGNVNMTDLTTIGTLTIKLDNPQLLAAPTDGLLARLGPLTLTGKLAASPAAVSITALGIEGRSFGATGRLDFALGARPEGKLVLKLPRLALDGALAKALTPRAGVGPAVPVPARGPGSGFALPKGPGFALPKGTDFTLDLGVDALSYKGLLLQKFQFLASLDDGEITISNAAVQLPGSGDVGLTGALKAVDGQPQFKGHFDLASDNFRILAQGFGLSLREIPPDRLNKLTANGRVTASASAVDLDAVTLRLDGDDYKFGAHWHNGPRPGLGLEVTAKHLNLDAYLPHSDTVAPAPAPAPSKTLARATGLGISLPTLPFDVAVKGTIGRVDWDEHVLDTVDLDAALTQGGLEITRCTIGNLAGSTASLAGKIGSGRRGPITLNLSLSAGDPAPLLSLFGWRGIGGGALGPVAISAHVGGTAAKLDLSVGASVGRTDIRLSGDLGPLAALSTLALKGHVEAPEARTLLRQLGYPGGGRDLGSAAFDLTLGGSPRQGKVHLGGHLGPAAVIADLVFDGGQNGRVAVKFDAPDNGALLLPAFGLPGPTQGPLSLTLDAARKGDTLIVSTLKGTIGNLGVSGNSTVTALDAIPRIDGRLALTSFDPRQFSGGSVKAQSPGQAGYTASGQPGGDVGRWSTSLLNMSPLRQVNGVLALSINNSVLGGVTVGHLTTKLTLDDGTLTLNDLAADLAPGRLTGQASLSAEDNGAAFHAILQVTGLDLDHLTKRAGDRPGLSGTLGATLDATTSGRSVFALVSNLGGTARIDATDGKIHGIDLARLSTGLKTVNQPGSILNRVLKGLKGGATDYHRLTAKWAIDKGNAKIVSSDSDVVGATIRANGNIDLPTWSERIVVQVKLDQPPDLPTVPITLSGPLDTPRTDVRTKDIGGYYLKKFMTPELKGLGVPGLDSAQSPGAIVNELFH